jgi:hypothetical protein
MGYYSYDPCRKERRGTREGRPTGTRELESLPTVGHHFLGATNRMHKHTCKCGDSWVHEAPPRDCTKEEYAARHTCPSCGTEVYMKDWGQGYRPEPPLDDDDLALASLVLALLPRV